MNIIGQLRSICATEDIFDRIESAAELALFLRKNDVKELDEASFTYAVEAMLPKNVVSDKVRARLSMRQVIGVLKFEFHILNLGVIAHHVSLITWWGPQHAFTMHTKTVPDRKDPVMSMLALYLGHVLTERGFAWGEVGDGARFYHHDGSIHDPRAMHRVNGWTADMMTIYEKLGGSNPRRKLLFGESQNMPFYERLGILE